MGPQVTISLQDILGPDALITEEGDVTVASIAYDTKEAAIKGAKASVRELDKFRLAGSVSGKREDKKIIFRFDGGVTGLPETWVTKSHRDAKPAILADIQKALEGYKPTYFNSSVNEGVVVAGDQIPFGLQFVYSDQDGLSAKFLKSAQVGGGKTWTSRPIETVEDAVALVKKAEALLS